MKFHIAMDKAGKHHVFTNKLEAAKISKEIETIDVPIDATGLRSFIQNMVTEIDKGNAKANSLIHDASIAPVTIPEVIPAEISRIQREQEFRALVEARWPELPYAFRMDLCCHLLEELRTKVKNDGS